MKATKLIAVAFFATMPVAVLACPAHDKQASSCMEGYSWDEETNACVEVVSS